jgi:hypothetical protein
MKANLKTLLTALLSVTALSMGATAYADGRGDGNRGERDGWRDGGRYEQRWDNRRHDNGRHEGWRQQGQRHPGYRNQVYYYAPPVVYPNRVYYGPTVYRNPPGASVIISLPPIIFR